MYRIFITGSTDGLGRAVAVRAFGCLLTWRPGVGYPIRRRMHARWRRVAQREPPA